MGQPFSGIGVQSGIGQLQVVTDGAPQLVVGDTGGPGDWLGKLVQAGQAAASKLAIDESDGWQVWTVSPFAVFQFSPSCRATTWSG